MTQPTYELVIAPSGRLSLMESAAEAAIELSKPLAAAFATSPSHGLLYLATNELQARLSPPLEAVRSFACSYLTRLCQTQGHEATNDLPPTPPPSEEELTAWIWQAPPMTGQEYLRA